MKRILVCGGRDLRPDFWVYSALAQRIQPWDTVITGGAPGADTIAHEFAGGMGCTTEVYAADWRVGRRAGPERNQRMLDVGKPDEVLAFPGGRGTADMLRRARRAGVPIFLAHPDGTVTSSS